MGTRRWLGSWPVYRQLTGTDRRGLGAAAKSGQSRQARTSTADAVVKSVCPYCAVGCAQNVYVKHSKVIQIEGDPDSPVSRGARRQGDPRRPAVHPDQRGGRPARAAAGRQRHRVPRRDHQLRPGTR